MFNDSVVTSVYKGQKVRLVYNESFLALNRDCVIDIRLGKDINNWKLHISFIEDITKGAFAADLIIENAVINITYSNWVSSDWIELVEPQYLSDDKKTVEIYLKMRTLATSDQDWRTLILTIWKVSK